mmetsp:Transcript_23147/g.22626  ORF Transcript_23147/g.22626 Transcript_23147/m.22626 type:complete len:90 (+) Transcript_23147:795-1064(+)
MALSLFQLILRYHDPELALYIDHCQVTPEMYATPWLLTYFSNKIEMTLLIKFWDAVMEEDDQLMIFFVSVALLTYNRDKLLECDTSNLP